MIIFTDGSSKKSNKVVIAGIVCLNEAERIKSIFYCYKDTLNYSYQESLHEFLSVQSVKPRPSVITPKINT